jgi:pimeloyl-ACP methyl ester carboxylesterase
MESVPHSEPACVKVNGIEVVYDTFGGRQAPPMLLIMGLANQMTGWREAFCAQLAGRGYWVIRFDNRDTGLSTHFDQLEPPGLLALAWAYLLGRPIEVPYTLSDMSNDALGLLDALAVESAHIVGVSLGGMIAQMMAIEHPERVRTLTSMLSSTNEPSLALPKPKTLILFKAAPEDRLKVIERAVKVRRALRGTGFPLDEEKVREQAAQSYDRSHVPGGAGRQMAAAMASVRLQRAGLRSIRAPTLVIHGEADPLLPLKHGIRTAQVIPRAELVVIRGLGHELPEAAWPQIIDTIARHAA